MRLLMSILLFYKKPAIPALIVSMGIGVFIMIFLGQFSLKTVGISFIMISLLFQYFVYEVMNPKEYYFYYNMGLSKNCLWGAGMLLSLFIGLIMALL